MNINQETKDEGIHVIYHSSFFDTPSLKSKVFQQFNLKKTPNPFTSENPIYSKAFLYKKNSSNQSCKKRYFFLTETGIYYSKEPNNVILVKKYMNYENTRVLYEEKPDLSQKKKSVIKDYAFIIKFFKNYHCTEIATDELEIYEKWRKFLAYKCIQHTFHEEFEVKKMIGKGSFAKVFITKFILILPSNFLSKTLNFL